jgi:hypothetical protein
MEPGLKSFFSWDPDREKTDLTHIFIENARLKDFSDW